MSGMITTAPAFMALLALALPAPPAQSRRIAVPMCGGGVTEIAVEGDAPTPDSSHACCTKLCHAGETRRKRAGGGGGCCA